MYPTTRDFIAALERAGELKRIEGPANPILEITEIADRRSKSRAPNLGSEATRRTDPRFSDRGGHALLFQSVTGADMPLVINQFGSYRRIEMALGCDPGGAGGGHRSGWSGLEGLAGRIAVPARPEPPRSFLDLLAKAKDFLPLLRIPPKRRRGSGLCQEVVVTGDTIDLTRLPLVRCWPHDG